jgi:RimJ/RimL family protein N-acetyltransferase
MLIIRKIHEDDAEQFLHIRAQINTESPYMLREPDELNYTIAQQREQINRWIAHENIGVFVVEDSGKLVGFLSAEGGSFKRNRHCAYIVVGIVQAYTGRGIGAQLFITVEDWARQHTITRLELTVMTTNQAGIALYKKRGFEIEGYRKHAIRVNDQYMDEYYMAKLLV